MKGLSEEDVRRFIRAHNIDNEHNWIAALLLDECHELDPWIRVDSNTPRDRELLLTTKEYGKIVGEWFTPISKDGWWVANCMPVTPTHYKELPPDPICENSAGT